MKHVFFNGQTGGLGRFFDPALKQAGLRTLTLQSRLGDAKGTEDEFEKISIEQEDQVTLVPLAGMVPVPLCEKNPKLAFQTNVTDTLALVKQFLEWCERRHVQGRVLYVSTGHVYAPKRKGERLLETDEVQPRSTYASTKLEAEIEIRSIFKKHGPENLKIARVFGLLSVDQPPTYVLPALVKRVQERNFSNLAGLDCVRDYLDTRDVCGHLAQFCSLDWTTDAFDAWPILNFCSGEGLAIRDLFHHVLEVAGVPRTEAYQDLTESPARRDDIGWMVGDPSRLAKIIGGHPRRTSLRETIEQAFRKESARP